MLMEEVTDERIQGLLANMMLRENGAFCNNTIMNGELRSMMVELMRCREKPTHCPSCNGDHL